MDLTPFAKLIKDTYGLTLSAESNEILVNAIKSRMSCQRVDSHDQYYNSLLTDSNEAHRLVDLLTINETYFFREANHYELFINHLFPELLKEKKDSHGKIKLLSAGCSSGEEPYSIAITLLEKYGPEILNSVSIIGCDINQTVLEKARQGIYGNHSFRGCNASVQDKYFMPLPNQQYKLADYIRNAVDFQMVNLLNETYPRQIKDIDIVFYRNVSIYFKPDVQSRIFQKLSAILNENGYVFTSATETFLHDVGILFLIERDGVFLYRKKIEVKVDDRRRYKLITPVPLTPASVKPLPDTRKPPKQNKSMVVSKTSPAPHSAPRAQTINQELFDKALYAAMNKKYSDAIDHINILLQNNPSLIKACNLKASILINLERLEEAKSITLDTLKMDEWNLECFIILGMIAKIECDYEEALKQFKTAVYIQPSCWLAHFYLAETYNTTGVTNEACREYAVAMKLMEKNGMADNGLTYFPISFSVDQLIHLCKYNITKLEDYPANQGAELPRS